MRNTRPTTINSSFEQKFREHRSSIQKKPRAILGPDHPLSHTLANPIESIFQTILNSTVRVDGVSQQELVDKTNWDAKTIRKYVKSLVNQGRVRKENRKYLAAINNMKAGRLKEAAFLMGFGTWGKLELLPPTTKYYEKFNAKNSIEIMLLTLANQIGAFVVYSLIEAINPKNIYLESDKLDGRLSALWFEKVISSDIQNLLYRFKTIMLNMMYSSGVGSNSRVKRENKVLTIDEISKLSQSLRTIYPELVKHFDQMKNALPQELDNYTLATQDAIYSEMNFERQDRCKHETFNARDNDMGYYIRVCGVCGKRWKIKKMSKTRQ